MGRWAQRRTAGGGPLVSPPTAQIILVTVIIDDPDTLFAQFDQAVDATEFTISNFKTSPSGKVPISTAQGGLNEVVLEFGSIVDGETSLTFSGSVPNVISPQTVELT